MYTFHFWRRYFCFAAAIITSGVAISTSWLINDQMHHEVKERKNVLALVQKYSFPHHRCPATNQLAKCDAKPSCCLWLYFESNAKMAWFISFQGCRNLLKIVNRILVCIGIINLQLFLQFFFPLQKKENLGNQFLSASGDIWLVPLLFSRIVCAS